MPLVTELTLKRCKPKKKKRNMFSVSERYFELMVSFNPGLKERILDRSGPSAEDTFISASTIPHSAFFVVVV